MFLWQPFLLLLLISKISTEQLIRDKRQGRKHGDLPPGLAKKQGNKRGGGGGFVPPGHGGGLPPGLAKKQGAGNKDRTPESEEPEYEHFEPQVHWDGTEEEGLRILAEFIDRAGEDQDLPTDRSSLFLPNLNPHEIFQSCHSIRNRPGHCRYVQHCALPEFITSYRTFYRNICIIRNSYIGVCCPDTQSRPPAPPLPRPPTRSTTTLRPTPSVSTSAASIDGCGLNYKTRIVGGTQADPKDWIWMAALLRQSKQFCGGVLINEYYVLTAAHCTASYEANSIKVRLGEYDFNDDTDGRPEDFDVTEIKKHPNFDRFTYRNDICLLKLSRPAYFSDFVRPICLPATNRDYEGEKGTVAGWGTLSFGGKSSNVLRQITIPVWNNGDCDKTFSQNITREFICAGYTDGKSDSCQGDSGGPLMVEGLNGRWIVIGLVSWGLRCAEPGYPGVYTRVTEYVSWIKRNAL